MMMRSDPGTGGRPTLRAVAVGVSGVPGSGFYTIARDIGYEVVTSTEEEQRFWREQLAAVDETWKTPLGSTGE